MFSVRTDWPLSFSCEIRSASVIAAIRRPSPISSTWPILGQHSTTRLADLAGAEQTSIVELWRDYTIEHGRSMRLVAATGLDAGLDTKSNVSYSIGTGPSDLLSRTGLA